MTSSLHVYVNKFTREKIVNSTVLYILLKAKATTLILLHQEVFKTKHMGRGGGGGGTATVL